MKPTVDFVSSVSQGFNRLLMTGALALTLGIGTLPATLLTVEAQTMGTPVAQAGDPYWDNSGNNGYYSPQPNNSYPTNQYPNNAQGQYNQGQYNQGQYGSDPNYGGGYNQYGGQPTELKGYVSTAPSGTRMSTTSSALISSEYAQIGDQIQVTLGQDIAANGQVIIPAGSAILGQVVNVRNAGRTGRHGELSIRFNRAQLPDGRSIPLSARLVTADGSGIIKGGTGKQRAGKYAKRTVGGAALGAGVGALSGLIANGGTGAARGAIWGSAIGGATGLGSAAVSRGEEAVIRPGEPLEIMLDQPLTVNNAPNNSYQGGYNNNYYQPQY